MTLSRTATSETQEGLSDEHILELRLKLESERTRILNSYKNDLRAGKLSIGEGGDDIVDLANQAYSREFILTLGDAERENLRRIEEALERVEKGAYGFCLYSGDAISLPRLRAVPWARYTVDIQEKIEKGLLEED